MKQLALAVVNYHDVHGHFPPAYVLGPDGRPWHSWRVLILPYIEQIELFDEYDFAEPWDGPKNRLLAERMPRTYAFHGEYQSGTTTTNYLAVVGPETAWPGTQTISYDAVTDGSSNTVMVVENQGESVHWMEPRDLTLADMDLTIHSPRGVSSKYKDAAVAMLDGSLQRLRPDISPQTLRALLTIAGGEPVRNGGEEGWELLSDGRQRPLRKP